MVGLVCGGNFDVKVLVVMTAMNKTRAASIAWNKHLKNNRLIGGHAHARVSKKRHLSVRSKRLRM